MSRNGIAAALVIALSGLAAACVPDRGELEVKWTFEGLNCAEVGAKSIRVHIDGEILRPDTFSCAQAGGLVTGAHLGSYLTGAYDLTVTAADATGDEIYRASKRIHVGAIHNVIEIDLKPVLPAGTGQVALLWKFEGQTCAQAGVTTVRVWVDDQAVELPNGSIDLACSSGGVDGVLIGPVNAGRRLFYLEGWVGQSLVYTLDALPLDVVEGATLDATANLLEAAPSTGLASVRWSFDEMSCAAAKVDRVRVYVDGQDAGEVACATSGAEGAIVEDLTPGEHSFSIMGIRGAAPGGQLVYQTKVAVKQQFQAGLTTAVIVDGDALDPAKGGGKLTWKFPAGGPSCADTSRTLTVSYQLTPPGSSTPLAARTATCGGPNAIDGVVFCNPASTCPAGSEAALTAGLWKVTATATVDAIPYAASSTIFAVPNVASGAADIQLTQ